MKIQEEKIVERLQNIYCGVSLTQEMWDKIKIALLPCLIANNVKL